MKFMSSNMYTLTELLEGNDGISGHVGFEHMGLGTRGIGNIIYNYMFISNSEAILILCKCILIGHHTTRGGSEQTSWQMLWLAQTTNSDGSNILCWDSSCLFNLSVLWLITHQKDTNNQHDQLNIGYVIQIQWIWNFNSIFTTV